MEPTIVKVPKKYYMLYGISDYKQQIYTFTFIYIYTFSSLVNTFYLLPINNNHIRIIVFALSFPGIDNLLRYCCSCHKYSLTDIPNEMSSGNFLFHWHLCEFPYNNSAAHPTVGILLVNQLLHGPVNCSNYLFWNHHQSWTKCID